MLIPNLKRVGTLSQGIGVPDGSDVLYIAKVTVTINTFLGFFLY